jgi:hypothetical protein
MIHNGVATKAEIILEKARTIPANNRIKNMEADKTVPSFILKGIITRPNNISPNIRPMIFINFS